jgi:hypothetical protein
MKGQAEVVRSNGQGQTGVAHSSLLIFRLRKRIGDPSNIQPSCPRSGVAPVPDAYSTLLTLSVIVSSLQVTSWRFHFSGGFSTLSLTARSSFFGLNLPPPRVKKLPKSTSQ